MWIAVMIKRRYSYIFKILLISVGIGLFTLPSFGQNELNSNSDTLLIDLSDSLNILNRDIKSENKIVPDSLVTKKFISGLELVIDYGKILTLWTNFESKYEAGINLRFYERIVLATEFGYAELNPLKAYDNALYYTVTGSYARAGLDYYTSYDPKSFYYAGFRYGKSFFEDEGAFFIDSEYWEDYQEGFGSSDLTASWVEIVLGTETFLKFGKKSEDPKSKFLIGWKFRLRILTDFENREEPRIYSIPGYGRTFDNVVPAVNFYIKYRFGN
jgi:hypothetical protein